MIEKTPAAAFQPHTASGTRWPRRRRARLSTARKAWVSAGSACHRGKLSHVVTALGLDKRTAGGVLRVSFGPETTFADIDALYEALLRHKNTRFSML